MFGRALKAEGMKLRHSPVWLAFIQLPILPALIGTFNYVQNIGILQDEWYSLWTQHTLFSCYFFLPAIIGVYCSYLYRLEHLNHNWNSVMTMPIPVSYFFLAKLCIASAMVILTQVWTGVLYLLSGKLAGLSSPVPGQFPEWLLTGAAGAIVICAVQLCFSLMIRSFAVPVGLALMGGIAGLGMLAKGYGGFFPYSLLSLGMRANQPGGPMQCALEHFLLSCALYVLACVLWAALWMKRRDVHTG